MSALFKIDIMCTTLSTALHMVTARCCSNTLPYDHHPPLISPVRQRNCKSPGPTKRGAVPKLKKSALCKKLGCQQNDKAVAAPTQSGQRWPLVFTTHRCPCPNLTASNSNLTTAQSASSTSVYSFHTGRCVHAYNAATHSIQCR